VIATAKIMRPRSMAKSFSGTVKEILGTAASVGCTVDKRKPRDIQADIDNGTIVIPDYEAPQA
jgi:large subunit ribosomal protein L12e